MSIVFTTCIPAGKLTNLAEQTSTQRSDFCRIYQRDLLSLCSDVCFSNINVSFKFVVTESSDPELGECLFDMIIKGFFFNVVISIRQNC